LVSTVTAEPDTSQRQAPSAQEEPYGCDLANLPVHLIPRRLLNTFSRLPIEVPVRLGVHCWLDNDVPRPLTGRVPSVVHRDPWTLWVQNAGTGIVAPYLLDGNAATFIARSRRGEESARLTTRNRALLATIGALARTDALDEVRWMDAIERGARAFDNGYVAISGLVHPFHLACLRVRYRRLIRRGAFRLGDTQSALRYVCHNEPVAVFFHHQLTNVVARLVGSAVRPSYVYLAGYEPGAELPPHVDRAQCEYTLAMCIDASPEPICETAWPLRLRLPDRDLTVFQAIGDALLYRGREIPHFRDQLAPGRTSVQLFFHYVDEGFSGPLE
jgi:hypothetical protein